MNGIHKSTLDPGFTRFYESYWLPEKFGFDTRKVQFSSLILTGQMSREIALEKLKQPAHDPASIHHDFEYVASKLDMTIKELQACFDSPNKTYRDYANRKHCLSKLVQKQ